MKVFFLKGLNFLKRIVLRVKALKVKVLKVIASRKIANRFLSQFSLSYYRYFLLLGFLVILLLFLIYKQLSVDANASKVESILSGRHIEFFFETKELIYANTTEDISNIGDLIDFELLSSQGNIVSEEKDSEIYTGTILEKKQDDFSQETIIDTNEEIYSEKNSQKDAVIDFEIQELEKYQEEKNYKSLNSDINKNISTIVLVFKNLGIGYNITEKAFALLPNNVTFGFSPYSPYLQKWVDKTISEDREFIIHIPMETKNFELQNPGPYALKLSSDNSTNLERLIMLLSLTKGYNVVYSEVTDIFSHSSARIIPILEELKKRGLSFLYGGGYNNFSFIQIAREYHYPVLVNDIIVDEVLTEESINKKLLELEKISKKKKYAIAMVNPYLVTIKAIKKWLTTLDSKGIQVVPISFLLLKE